jgi:hypothetical protein
VNDNFRALVKHAGLTADEVIALAKNSFNASFLEPAAISRHLSAIDAL